MLYKRIITILLSKSIIDIMKPAVKMFKNSLKLDTNINEWGGK